MPPPAQPSASPGGWTQDPVTGQWTQDPTQSGLAPLLTQLQAKHGPVLGQAYNTNPTISNPDKVLSSDPATIPNPNPTYRYLFTDGTSMDATSDGQVASLTEKTPSADTNAAHPPHTDATTGNLYIWGKQADGTDGYIKAPGLPTSTSAAGRTSVDQLQTIKDPNTGKAIGFLDPINGTHIPLPTTTADKPQLIQTTGGGIYSYDGTTLSELRPPGSTPLTPVQEAQAKVDLARSQRLLEQTQAQTSMIPVQSAEIAARTAQTNQATAQATAMAPAQLAELNARTAQTQAQMDQAAALAPATLAEQQAKATAAQNALTRPTVVSAPADQLSITTMSPTGQFSSGVNPAFQPKTMADVAGRVGQLQAAAQQQRDALQAKQQSGAITADQAAQQFNSWWAQNVEPQKAQLDVAQRQAQVDAQQAADASSRNNLQIAQQAGANAVDAYKAQLPNMVGPGFGKAMNQLADSWATGKPPTGIDWNSALTYQMPDLVQLGQQVTSQALAHISPTAAQNMSQASGQQASPQMAQMPQSMDISQQLNQTNYTPVTTVSPSGQVTVTHQVQPAQQPPQQFPGLAQGGVGNGQFPLQPPQQQQIYSGLNQGIGPYQPSF